MVRRACALAFLDDPTTCSVQSKIFVLSFKTKANSNLIKSIFYHIYIPLENFQEGQSSKTICVSDQTRNLVVVVFICSSSVQSSPA